MIGPTLRGLDGRDDVLVIASTGGRHGESALIVAGETSDKAEVAARVAHAGAGINLRTPTPTATEVAAAVDDVLGEERYRLAARRLSEEIAGSAALETIAECLAGLPSVVATPASY